MFDTHACLATFALDPPYLATVLVTKISHCEKGVQTVPLTSALVRPSQIVYEVVKKTKSTHSHLARRDCSAKKKLAKGSNPVTSRGGTVAQHNVELKVSEKCIGIA